MTEELRHPPSASCLTASMRDIGYSLETAIADLIDNSISAGAEMVELVCNLADDEPALVILDNGRGMSHDELLAAMRHGAINPAQQRSSDDLGRFGLGLKTASFSQCRSLTVLTRRDNCTSAAEWNLDLIRSKDDWILRLLDDKEIRSLPCADRLPTAGTAVIWRHLDRMGEGVLEDDLHELVNEKLAAVNRHLSLVFHRFLAGKIRKRPRLMITINGDPVKAFDPFCRDNPATQVLPEEVVRLKGSDIRLQPYILPHYSRMSAKQYNYYTNRSDFISNQGVYVYRNGRLMAWGGWFRLMSNGEATKLARVQIDFPNSLDEDWTIDIKKSRAHPPPPIRERMRQIIDRISERSVRVHRGRGERLFSEVKAPLWTRHADRTGIQYEINEKHPLLSPLLERLEKNDAALLRLVLASAASSLPVEMVYSDYSTKPREIRPPGMSSSEAQERLEQLRNVLHGDGAFDAAAFMEVVRSTHLFDDKMDLAESFATGAPA